MSKMLPTRIPIYTLSGGVARQAPSKRTPSESEELDNVLCTLERSIEKRPGSEVVVPVKKDFYLGTNTTLSTLDLFDAVIDFANSAPFWVDEDPDLPSQFTVNDSAEDPIIFPEPERSFNDNRFFWHWIEFSESKRILVMFDTGAHEPNFMASPPTDIPLFRSWLLDLNGDKPRVKEQTLDNQSESVPLKVWNYVCHNPNNLPADEFLSVTNVGPNLIVLNKEFEAGYLETGVGAELDYLTSRKTDPRGEAQLYKNATKYDVGDIVYIGDGVWRALNNDTVDSRPPLTGTTNTSNWAFLRNTVQISVEDDVSPVVSKPELGQSVENFTEIPLPPDPTDIFDVNNAEEVLKELYPNDGISLVSNIDARAKFEMTVTSSTLTDHDNDTFILIDVNNVSTTFTFDKDVATTTNTIGLSGLSTTATIASKIKDCINTFNYTATIKDNDSSTVVVRQNAGGTIGNTPIVETCTHITFAPAFGGFIPETYDPNDPFGSLPFPLIQFDPLNQGGASNGDFSVFNGGIGISGEIDFSGRGKIWYAREPHLSRPSGFYRTISFSTKESTTLNETIEQVTGQGKPFLKLIRTPYEYSVLDASTMPMALTYNFDAEAGGADPWKFDTIGWEMRVSGDNTTNPGPSPFKDPNGESKKAKIKSLAFFRDRLFFSSGDTIFSSQMGDFTNLWIEDPTSIIDTDPIDVRASTNKFAEITHMIPFENYIFINTKANIQFLLTGSQNNITPLTAELSPRTFYSTAPLVEPQVMGSQMYFYDEERLYIFFSDANTSLNRAVEVSKHCPEYLPKRFTATSVAAPIDTVMTVDFDKQNEMYLYTNRFSGANVTQNAFFKWKFVEGFNIQCTETYDNHTYMVAKRAIKNQDGVVDGYKYFIERVLTRSEDSNIPRIDHRYLVRGNKASSLAEFAESTTRDNFQYYYDTTHNVTFVRVPFSCQGFEEVMLGPSFGSRANVRVNASVITSFLTYDSTLDSKDRNASDEFYTVFKIEGDDYTKEIGSSGLDFVPEFYVGKRFTMLAELSQQYVRDEKNNVVEGQLNLRTLTSRHYKTGDYDIAVIHNDRNTTTGSSNTTETLSTNDDYPQTRLSSSFHAPRTGDSEDSLPTKLIEIEGEMLSKIMGYSHATRIFIKSDYPSPCNITQIELRGKFKATNSSASV
mgnify:CR=1 FL=1|tara:strand:+ start:1030 stop:4506 length:3477 start_codon:yes stop_codon:yes gene_type:complete